MKLILKYDQEGNYIPGEDQVIGDDATIPESYTDIPLPVPNWLPKFNKQLNTWEETAGDDIKNPINHLEPSDVDYIKQQNGFLTKELAKTQQMNLILANQLGDVILMLAQQSNNPLPQENPSSDEPVAGEDIEKEGD